MNSKSVFTHTSPELLPILEELRRREPIFHTLAFAASPAEYEEATAPEYWEVGASGTPVQSRLHPAGAVHDAASALGYLRVAELGSCRPTPWTRHFPMTYVLRQGDRLTRRATIWEHLPGRWRVLFHQGTVVVAEEDYTVSCVARIEA